jgi:hypothetical protein
MTYIDVPNGQIGVKKTVPSYATLGVSITNKHSIAFYCHKCCIKYEFGALAVVLNAYTLSVRLRIIPRELYGSSTVATNSMKRAVLEAVEENEDSNDLVVALAGSVAKANWYTVFVWAIGNWYVA